MRNGGRVATVVGAAVLMVPLGAAAAPLSTSWPGVVVDTRRGAVYVASPGGGIEAVDIERGRTLWTNANAAVPLALNDRFLLAQGEGRDKEARLPLLLLDLDGQGLTVFNEALALPEGASAVVEDTLKRSFRAWAEAETSAFIIHWTYRQSLVRGRPRIVGEGPPERTDEGHARLDLRTRRLSSLEPQVAMRGASPLPARVASLAQAGVLPHEPWRAGAALAVAQGGRGKALLLKRWDATTGAALPERTLVSRGLVALASTDRAHVLATERVGEGGPRDPEYRWTLFSAETGEPVGEVRNDIAAARFAVWKTILLFEAPPGGSRVDGRWRSEPLALRAVSASGGDPRWDRVVRQLDYRGALPPVE
jgi:hypothetical protein